MKLSRAIAIGFLVLLFIALTSAEAFANDCRFALSNEDADKGDSPSPEKTNPQLEALSQLQGYEELLAVLTRSNEIHISTIRSASMRGADQPAISDINRLSIEKIRGSIRTGNIEAAVMELQPIWLKTETAYLKRMLDQQMIKQLEESTKTSSIHNVEVQEAIARLKARQEENDQIFAANFGLYKAQREFIEQISREGDSVDPRDSLADDPALSPTPARARKARSIAPESMAIQPAPAIDAAIVTAGKILGRVGLTGTLQRPNVETLSSTQQLVLSRPSLDDMQAEFFNSHKLNDLRADRVRSAERRANLMTWLTHASMASTRMKWTRSLPKTVQPLARFVLMLSADSYKRRIHVPQIFSILDSHPKILATLEGPQREAAILAKLVSLLEYSSKNNDKDDLLNTMARGEQVRELWREMRTVALKLHQNEASVRKEALAVSDVELNQTSWGLVVLRMDQASKEAQEQGGFSLTGKPSRISMIATYTERLARIAGTAYIEYHHNIVGSALDGILNLIR